MSLILLAGPVQAAPRVPNDTFFPQQWHLEKIGAPEAWNSSLGFEGIVVAVIDSGVDIDHPDLKDNVWQNLKEIPGNGIDDDSNGYVDDVWGWDFIGDDPDPRPDTSGAYSRVGVSHGTVNAGIIAARGDNGQGITGVTWQSRIMAIRALDSDGSGDPNSVVRAVEYAVANGAKIINLSFTGESHNEILAIAIRRAYDAGVLVVAAAGNAIGDGPAPDLDRYPLYPVCLDQGSEENFIIGVAATDQEDRKATFSAFGAGCVDISAPGDRLISTQFYRPGSSDFSAPYGGYYNGTSVAAAEISGVAALMFALDRSLTPKQVTNIMIQTSVDTNHLNPGLFGKVGRGRVDAAKAVSLVMETVRNHDIGLPPAEPITTSLMPEGQGNSVVVAVPGPGRDPEVRLFTDNGVFIRSFLAFPKAFKGGVNLALGDFGDGRRSSIVTGAGPGGGPHVRVFNANGQPIGGFFAYDLGFRGGVSVAAGDLDGDGRDEIITGAGPGGGPHVRVFNANGQPIGGFFAYDLGFRGGVSVAAGDIDGDGIDEIIVSSGADPANLMPTTVRVYDGHGHLISQFNPSGVRDFSGLRVRVDDTDADGWGEIIGFPIGSGSDSVSVFEIHGEKSADIRLDPDSSFRLSGNAKRQMAFGLLPGQEPMIMLPSSFSDHTKQFYAFEPKFRGGVQAILME